MAQAAGERITVFPNRPSVTLVLIGPYTVSYTVYYVLFYFLPVTL